MIKGVHHTCITVSDLERSVTFYRDALGLELVMTEESERSGDDRSKGLGVAKAKVKLAVLRAGGAQVELIFGLLEDIDEVDQRFSVLTIPQIDQHLLPEVSDDFSEELWHAVSFCFHLGHEFDRF